MLLFGNKLFGTYVTIDSDSIFHYIVSLHPLKVPKFLREINHRLNAPAGI